MSRQIGKSYQWARGCNVFLVDEIHNDLSMSFLLRSEWKNLRHHCRAPIVRVNVENVHMNMNKQAKSGKRDGESRR